MYPSVNAGRGEAVTAPIRWFFLAVGVSAILVVVFLIVSAALDGGGS